MTPELYIVVPITAQIERRLEHDSGSNDDGHERQHIDLVGLPAQHDDLNRPHDDCSKAPKVTDVDGERVKKLRITTQYDGRCPGDRQHHAPNLARRDAMRQEHRGQDQYEHRKDCHDQRALNRRRVLEAGVVEVVEQCHRDEAERGEVPPTFEEQAALAPHPRSGEWQQNDQRQRPAPEVEGKRRNFCQQRRCLTIAQSRRPGARSRPQVRGSSPPALPAGWAGIEAEVRQTTIRRPALARPR